MSTLRWTLLAAAALAASACGGDDDGGTGPTTGLQPSTSYLGFVSATDGSTAALTITFASPVALRTGTGSVRLLSAVTSATGTIEVSGGGTIALTGSLDGTALSLSGSGVTLTGTLDQGRIAGTVAGSGLTGAFAALSSSETVPARAYCGTFAGTSVDVQNGELETGTFNLVVAGGVVQGTSAGADGLFPFNGTANEQSGALTITISTSGPSGSIAATGTTQENFTRLTGTYGTKDPQGQPVVNGTFAGAPCPDRPEDALVGTWVATKVEYTSVSNPAQKVNLIDLGGAFTFVLQSGGALQATVQQPGTLPVQATGSWQAAGTVLTLQVPNTPLLQFTYGLSGTTLTLSGAQGGYDFNGDGQDEPATVGATFVKQ